MNKIAIITDVFPSELKIEHGSFTYKLANELRAQGNVVTVFHPISLVLYLKGILLKGKFLSFEDNCNGISIYRGLYVSFPWFQFRSRILRSCTNLGFYLAVRRSFSLRTNNDFDYFYAQFLMPSGYSANRLSREFGIPYFLDVGESYSLVNECSYKFNKLIIDNAKGVFTVSRILKNIMNDSFGRSKNVFFVPNKAGDNFKPIDKNIARDILGLKREIKLICFVGHFIERKGPLRVLAAMRKLDKGLYGAFLGNGPQIPKGPDVLANFSVHNTKLPIWLNASDVFVLPTLAEGRCNVIEEALSCGIVSVVSHIPEVLDQLDDRFALTCDPNSVDDIALKISEALALDRSSYVLPTGSRGELINNIINNMFK